MEEKNIELQIIANGETVFESYDENTVGYAVLRECGNYNIAIFGKEYMDKFPALRGVFNKLEHDFKNLHREKNPIKFDETVVYILKGNLEHCIGLLDKDGINAKAKVKKQLKRLLDTYFAEEESQEENNSLQTKNNVVE